MDKFFVYISVITLLMNIQVAESLPISFSTTTKNDSVTATNDNETTTTQNLVGSIPINNVPVVNLLLDMLKIYKEQNNENNKETYATNTKESVTRDPYLTTNTRNHIQPKTLRIKKLAVKRKKNPILPKTLRVKKRAVKGKKVNRKIATTTEDYSTTGTEDYVTIIVEDDSTIITDTEDYITTIIEYDSNSIIENDSTDIIEDYSTTNNEDYITTIIEDDSTITIEDYSTTNNEDYITIIVEDDSTIRSADYSTTTIKSTENLSTNTTKEFATTESHFTPTAGAVYKLFTLLLNILTASKKPYSNNTTKSYSLSTKQNSSNIFTTELNVTSKGYSTEVTYAKPVLRNILEKGNKLILQNTTEQDYSLMSSKLNLSDRTNNGGPTVTEKHFKTTKIVNLNIFPKKNFNSRIEINSNQIRRIDVDILKCVRNKQTQEISYRDKTNKKTTTTTEQTTTMQEAFQIPGVFPPVYPFLNSMPMQLTAPCDDPTVMAIGNFVQVTCR